jgi:DNA-binding NtrC family response regulator
LDQLQEKITLPVEASWTSPVRAAGEGVGRAIRSVLLLLIPGSDSDLLIFGSDADEFPKEAQQALERMIGEALAERSLETTREVGPILVGSSDTMEQVRRKLRALAPGKATVLIVGESGTGKEVAARLLHHLSARSHRPFLAVNLGAVAETLLDSELFGHRRGSFTGAVSDRAGLFEQAHAGTLLLDEVGEASGDLQVRLLRAIQEREVRRVGDSGARQVDVRLLAATNRNLSEMVRGGAFREDLYYRIRVGVITMPALRDHLEDLAEIFDHILSRLIDGHPRLYESLDGATHSVLQKHDWPGNVRELENMVQRIVALRGAAGGFLEPAHVESFVREEWRSNFEETPTVAVTEVNEQRQVAAAAGPTGTISAVTLPVTPPRSTADALADLRREAYRVCESNIGTRLGRAFCSHWFRRTGVAAQQHLVPLDGPLIPRGTTERHISPNNAVCRSTLASPMINASFCSVDDTQQFRHTMSRKISGWQDLRPYRCITADFWCVWCPVEPFGLARFGALSFGEVFTESSRFEEKMASLRHRAQHEEDWNLDLSPEQIQATRKNLRQISSAEEEAILKACWSISRAFGGAIEEVTRRGLAARDEEIERLCWIVDRLVVPWVGQSGEVA